ncbi:hypothetical protein [Zavarzinella formosa]|uniref:hypothetical protein n=1 Tax=Zavarzinella formosa TaxID=360055 RepID=UPI0002EF154F|nr:hypothetical protein [Zavarzinella formosa]
MVATIAASAKNTAFQLDTERNRGDAVYEKLLELLRNGDDEERELAEALRQQIDRYRSAGDELLSQDNREGDLERYHRTVNPLLRHAAGGCEKLRAANFRAMRQTGGQH